MRKVILRMNEKEKYEVIKELVDHNGNKDRAAVRLEISIRQVDRLIRKYKETGKSAFVHGNRYRKPSTTLEESISEAIIQLYKTKYKGFNFTHFKELLEEIEGIKVSYKFVYSHLIKAGFVSTKARRKTKRAAIKKELLKDKILSNKTIEEIEVIVNREVALKDSHPRQEKPKYFGEVIEADGSIHLWFGDKKACLHLAADKTTNTIVGGYFDHQETLHGYYQVKYQILTNYGKPYSYLTDNRTVFNYMSTNPDKRVSEKDTLTQFGYSCKQLGIKLNTTSVAQKKGLIERDNETFQDRLVNEFRLYNINDIDKANEYLVNTFIPNFNKRFAYNPKDFKSVFEKSPSAEVINYTLAVLEARKIDKGNSIKYKNNYYLPYLNNNLICLKPKTECLVIKAFDGTLLVSAEDKIYELVKLESHQRISPNIDTEIIEPIKEKKKYIPPMTHPWKAKSFKKYTDNAHNHHQYN